MSQKNNCTIISVTLLIAVLSVALTKDNTISLLRCVRISAGEPLADNSYNNLKTTNLLKNYRCHRN